MREGEERYASERSKIQARCNRGVWYSRGRLKALLENAGFVVKALNFVPAFRATRTMEGKHPQPRGRC